MTHKVIPCHSKALEKMEKNKMAMDCFVLDMEFAIMQYYLHFIMCPLVLVRVLRRYSRLLAAKAGGPMKR